MATIPSLHVLDVGAVRYGDSILIRVGERNILIDGAHPSDSDLIGDQIGEVLGIQPPYPIDLLVVTHCHGDHMGCLPQLVSDGVINVRKALVADETLGLGPVSDSVATSDAANRLFAALREEPIFSTDEREVAAFIEDAANVEARYRTMLASLEQSDVPVIRYKGQNLSSLEAEFSEFGLKILGPTRAHLEKCAEELARLRALAARSTGRRGGATDSISELAAIYREIVGAASDDLVPQEDKPGSGAALNNQSIVLKVVLNETPVLLTGDQQFAKPEVSGLSTMMTALRNKIKSAGPYTIVKASHHGSYNGLDETVLEEHGAATLLFTGGFNDPGHPSRSVLNLLKDNQETLMWARTDKNGRIDVDFADGEPQLAIQRGDFSDFEPNPSTDVPPAPEVQPEINTPQPQPQQPQLFREARDIEFTGTIRIPPDVTRIQITIDVQRERQTAPPGSGGSSKPEPPDEPGGASLPPGLPAGLLFVTDTQALTRKLGSATVRQTKQMIEQAGHEFLDIRSGVPSPWTKVQAQLRGKSYPGVILLGDYDVLPSARMDAIGPELRAEMGPEGIAADSDRFLIWSDDVYGDIEGDQDPEVAVSRIPDCGNPAFFLSLLTRRRDARIPTWGLRNSARPFADIVHRARASKPQRMLASLPTAHVNIQPAQIGKGSLYFMLHGADYDTSWFWGENSSGDVVEAFQTGNIPGSYEGTVFAGCCYGALIAQPAVRIVPGQPVRPILDPERSIALRFLQAGANAFIGCTGTHYSPNESPYAFFGGPLHEAFFRSYDEGKPPAAALLAAKQAFGRGFPHGMKTAAGQAIELKIMRVFTCLGLGW